MDEALKAQMQVATDRALAQMDETDRKFDAWKRQRHERTAELGDAIEIYKSGDRCPKTMHVMQANGIQIGTYFSLMAVVHGNAPREFLGALTEEVNDARRELGSEKPPRTARDFRCYEGIAPFDQKVTQS